MDNNDFIHSMSNLSFAEIKNKVSELLLNINEENSMMLEGTLQALEDDRRKNVLALGEKVKKKLNDYRDEVLRVKKLYAFDRSFGSYRYIAGVDEVGRGPVAGPVVGAAVVLDLDFLSDSDLILYINDSKKLSEPLREKLSNIIKSKALSYNIVTIDSNEVDEKGIAYCNNEVLKLACKNLSIKPELVLSDGYLIKNLSMKNEFVIKGDAKSASIACASIIAKVHRDNLMKEYDKIYPQYGFAKHVGYGTKEHMTNIESYGITPIHRKSFLTKMIY